MKLFMSSIRAADHGLLCCVLNNLMGIIVDKINSSRSSSESRVLYPTCYLSPASSDRFHAVSCLQDVSYSWMCLIRGVSSVPGMCSIVVMWPIRGICPIGRIFVSVACVLCVGHGMCLMLVMCSFRGICLVREACLIY